MRTMILILITIGLLLFVSGCTSKTIEINTNHKTEPMTVTAKCAASHSYGKVYRVNFEQITTGRHIDYDEANAKRVFDKVKLGNTYNVTMDNTSIVAIDNSEI
jgi:hypothetical protein